MMVFGKTVALKEKPSQNQEDYDPNGLQKIIHIYLRKKIVDNKYCHTAIIF